MTSLQDPVFLGQLAFASTLYVSGITQIEAIEENEEEYDELRVREGIKLEGEDYDIYRDSPLRYAGYLNECGEAFRPIVPGYIVILSYFESGGSGEGKANLRIHKCGCGGGADFGTR